MQVWWFAELFVGLHKFCGLNVSFWAAQVLWSAGSRLDSTIFAVCAFSFGLYTFCGLPSYSFGLHKFLWFTRFVWSTQILWSVQVFTV